MSPDRFNKIIETIKGGKNLIIATPLRAVRITAKCLAKWEKSGRPLLKNRASEDGFYVARGKSYDYIILEGCAVYFE